MPSSKDGIMVILSSPSGAGKTTLVNLLSKQNNFEISISHTTRKPRPGEVPNKDYFFVNDIEFKISLKNSRVISNISLYLPNGLKTNIRDGSKVKTEIIANSIASPVKMPK